MVAGAWGQLAAIAAGAAAGLALGSGGTVAAPARHDWRHRRTAIAALAVFAGLLAGLPLLRAATGSAAVAVADGFFRAGALVFGGGHVVLPLLRAAVVPRWLDGGTFLAGYGAAQALPGPLFAFAAYLGAAIGGAGLAAVALVAIFLPGMLLLIGALPFWAALQARAPMRAAARGVNAAVVGILAAALVSPVATGAIGGWGDLALAATGFAALAVGAPAWAVVAGLAAVSVAV